MKNNIIIKMEPFEISDAEIQEYMDFPGILKEHERGSFPWKYFLSVLVILSVSGILFFVKTDVDKTISTTTEPVIRQEINKEPENVPENGNLVDSLQITDEIDTNFPVEEMKEKSVSAPQKEITTKTEESELPAAEAPEMVFIKAEPKDGMTALYKYFDEQLKYPASELGTGVEGKTLVTFTVFKDGSIGEIFFESSLGESFDNEAIRVLEQMSAWLPARVNDEPVDSKISIPLYFEEQ